MNVFRLFKKIQHLTISGRLMPKIILRGGLTASASYLIYRSYQNNGIKLPKFKNVFSVYAATNVNDSIKSLNVIADVVETISPSVVSITVSGSYFGTSFGSGFIVDEVGYILTNAHVVGRSSVVQVKLPNGNSLKGEVIAIDKLSDLALVQVNPGRVKLHALKLADVSKLRAGEFVIALGSPMTLSNSVTVGVVSAVERDLGHSQGLKYIQTDAIITVGNSGGPLVNLYGEVIGVNTMMASTGFGFAIPANHCQRFVSMALQNRKTPKRPEGFSNNLVNTNRTQKGGDGSEKYLGIIMGSLTPEMAFEMDLMRPDYTVRPRTGVMIYSVYRNSPAHKYDMRPGDIIESVNGIQVNNTAEFVKAISVVDNFDIVVIREGRRVVLKNVTPEFD